ncbi:MAG TPA: hypothetical protein VFI47_24665 [Acidimicrobiales bacterium]|nr:hypothetical protein [Acidimicrobiales bacterium]
MAAITLATMGSWGDLFPFVGLGRALVARRRFGFRRGVHSSRRL